MTDTLNRTVYGRIFRGTHAELADTGPWDLIGAVFDKTNMPALIIEPGKQIYHAFSLAQSGSAVLALPENYAAPGRLYIAIMCDLKARAIVVSPTHGTSTVLLSGTDSDDDGDHSAFWTTQQDVTSLTITVPSTGDGGATTSFQVFMYEIPDLADFESYYDKQIGLGTSGDT